MNRVLALSCQNIYSHNFDNDYLLFNFAASVHVFHDQDKIINFK